MGGFSVHKNEMGKNPFLISRLLPLRFQISPMVVAKPDIT